MCLCIAFAVENSYNVFVIAVWLFWRFSVECQYFFISVSNTTNEARQKRNEKRDFGDPSDEKNSFPAQAEITFRFSWCFRDGKTSNEESLLKLLLSISHRCSFSETHTRPEFSPLERCKCSVCLGFEEKQKKNETKQEIKSNAWRNRSKSNCCEACVDIWVSKTRI